MDYALKYSEIRKIAALAVIVASDKSSFITGTVNPGDVGMTA